MGTVLKTAIITFCSAVTLISIFIGCSARTTLLVDYHIPAMSNRLNGRNVSLVIKDVRSDRQLFTAGSAQEFQAFRDSYDLTLVTSDKQRTPVGEKDLQGLFLEVFRKRLDHLGATSPADIQPDTPQLQILIKVLKIDLRDRKWIARASYEADLTIDNQLVARERVSGSAERVKIVGTKGADTILSEIFTEIINELDIVKLFEQAKMI